MFDTGNLVQLMRGGTIHTVIWCGYILVKQPDGLRYRGGVYRLDNGYWDCYYGDELTAFGSWHNK
jgi:hypothetical protein